MRVERMSSGTDIHTYASLSSSIRVVLMLATFAWSSESLAQDVLAIEPAALTTINSAEVPALEAGMVIDVHVEAGQHLDAGQALATLDDRDAQLAVERAEIDLRQAEQEAQSDLKVQSAKAALTLVRLDLTRAEDSVERYAKSVSSAQIDRLHALVTQAELELAQAEFEHQQQQLVVHRAHNALKIAQRGLERRQIRAPIDGQVATISGRPGEWVEPGDPILRIVDTTVLRAEAFVPAALAVKNLTASEAVFVVDRNNEPSVEFPGRITFVSPEVNRVDGKVRLWVDIDNTDGKLLPGISGRLLIDLTKGSE